MKRWLVSAVLFMPIWVFSQYYFYDESYLDPEFMVEIGFGVGVISCKTDLGNKDLLPSIKELKACINWKARIQWQGGLGLKATYSLGRVSAADSLIRGGRPGDIARKNRNLHFFSSIHEWSLHLEWFPRPWVGKNRGLQPFISAGVGYYRFNPQGEILGQLVDLHKLRTEGWKTQTYKLQQFNLIGGIGIRYEWNAVLSNSFAFEHRFLFTDHLDDVSTRFIDPVNRGSPTPEPDEMWLKEWYKLSDPLVSKPGAIRGNPGKEGAYSTLVLTVGMALNRRRLDKK